MGCGVSRESNAMILAGGPDGPGRPTKRVSCPSKWKYGKKITMEELTKMREEFWHTRVDGDPALWPVLRGAAEALLTGDEPLANSLLEAAQLTTPGGSLLSSYDGLGREYVVPKWAFSNPSDLAKGAAGGGKGAGGGAAGGGAAAAGGGGGAPIAVRFRVAPGEKDFTVSTTDGVTIFQLKDLLKAIISETSEDVKREIPLEAAQRIVYRGKELKDNESIKTAQIDPDFIVQSYFCRQQSAL